MNNKRRKELIVAIEKAKDVRYILDDVLLEEDECLSNMPENLERSEKYGLIENAVEALQDAIDSLSDSIDSIEEAMK